jgi:hypothetical protein
MIDAFLDAYGKGDGCPHNHPKGRRYITSSKQLADDLHEVLCKLGRGRKVRVVADEGSTSTMSTTGRSFQRRRDVWQVSDPGVPVDSDVLRRNVQRVRYEGTVYCVSTPHETIMVRRKGISMWSGNSPNLLLVVEEEALPAGYGDAWRSAATPLVNLARFHQAAAAVVLADPAGAAAAPRGAVLCLPPSDAATGQGIALSADPAAWGTPGPGTPLVTTLGPVRGGFAQTRAAVAVLAAAVGEA